jgi:hypothetical protein
MFNFKQVSGWTLELELECFVIFKNLEAENFPRGIQTELCDKLSKRCALDSGTLKAKVGNFKSESGHTNETNASKATKYIVENYGFMNFSEARALLKGYQLAITESA